MLSYIFYLIIGRKKLIPDVSQELNWLEDHSHTIKGIQRGLERETLRINADGSLAITPHPYALGSALTHKWITTDFAESLLEFITPVDEDINHMLTLMRDIHRFTARQLGDERMWPLSMPCYIEHEQNIKLAQYGTSNIGRLKTLYREGLKNRYGALMQTIAGVHYNFSLPMAFWKEKYGKTDKEAISAGYFRLIRNYYRFGWVIPYLFGASPAICSSFLHGKLTLLPFKRTNYDTYYLPYATSLRLSDLGYTNKLQNNIGITFNALHKYIAGLKWAMKTPSQRYQKIGLEKEGKRLQINSNLLQVENELYMPIRPKRVTCVGETLLDALENNGVEYIEVRSLDINPFLPIGIDEQQVRFLDIFMIWCVLADTLEMTSEELQCIRANWNKVVLEGRRPGVTIYMGYKKNKFSLVKVGKELFQNLQHIAKILDDIYGGDIYQKVCITLVTFFDNPELTLSARILRSMIEQGMKTTGCTLSTNYRNMLRREPFEILNETDFVAEREASILRQKEIEIADIEPFNVFLAQYN